MKKIFLGAVFSFGFYMLGSSQPVPATTVSPVGTVTTQTKPQTVVELSKARDTASMKDTAKAVNTAKPKKKPCCKKGGEATNGPDRNNDASTQKKKPAATGTKPE